MIEHLSVYIHKVWLLFRSKKCTKVTHSILKSRPRIGVLYLNQAESFVRYGFRTVVLRFLLWLIHIN